MFLKLNKKTIYSKIQRNVTIVVLLILVASTVGFLNPRQANAAFPKYVNFQGKLTAVSGGTNVANGTYAFEFKIYDDPSAGSLLFTETFDQPSGACTKLTVTSGVFNAKLGSCNALTLDVTGGALYVSVNFAPTGTSYDGEMSPRKQLVASAFSFNANNVVGDGRIDIAYAPGTTTNPAGKIDYSPSVSSSNNALQVTSGSNVTGAALVVTQNSSGAGIGINLAGSGASSRVINSTSSALILQTTTSGNINLNSAGGTLELQDNTNITGALTVSGAITNATGYNGLVITANTGVITSGTWNGTDIAVLDGGTGASTSQAAINNLSQLTTNGDLLYHNGTNSTRLPRGADTECLKANTTTILWGSCGGGSQTPWTSDIDADNFSLLDFGPNLTSRSATTIGSSNNGAGASGLVTLNSGTGTTATGGVTLITGNASAGTAGNISLDVGTSTSGNGSILIGTAARTQTITIGNSTGGIITLGASSGSDLVLNDAQWSVTGAGAATFASLSGGAGSFTTLTSSGATTLGTGASLTNTFGSGASSINTIGAVTTPGALTLHGATTLDNTFTVSGSNLTSLGGNLTVTGTAWTATPTISGLITATSGLTSNGTLTVSGGQNLAMASGTGILTQIFTGTTTTAHAITANSLTTGLALNVTSSSNTAAATAWSANQFNITNAQGTTASTNIAGFDLQFTQAPTIAANTETAARIALKQNDSSSTDNAVASILSIENNDTATGSQIVATDALKIVAGTASNITNGINISGTFASNLITSTNFSVTQAGLITGVGVNSGSGLLQGTGGLTLTGTTNINTTGSSVTTIGAASGTDLALLDANWSITGAGVASFASLDSAGVIQAGSSNVNLTDASGFVQHDSLVDCADTQILKWATGGGRWGCAADETSGGGSSLQSAYGGDADGSDATISLTTADDSIIFLNPTSSGTDSAFTVKIDQANTTAAVLGLDIIQQSNAANAVNITANTIDTETGLALTADALTSGNGLTIASSAAAFTGALAKFTLSGSNAANTGSVIRIDNTGTNSASTGLYIDHRATGTGNLAFRIDDVASDTTPLIVDGDGRLGIGTSSITGTTERLLQVGSATNRGNSATYGEVITKGTKDIEALTNIKDTFIYDTSLDSDGGRWIDWSDTEQQSWFTETLDDGPSDPCSVASDDRCYSGAFPRKAILVVTTSSLYIFDATNGNMWMKFNQNASSYALGVDTNNDPSSVTAKNGVVYVGTNGSSAAGLYVLDFVNDRMWNYDDTDRSGADLGIGSRNSAITYASDNNTNFDIATVGTIAGWKTINDVSVEVVQNSQTAVSTTQAPNNATTVVALATDSGLTVVNLTTQKIRQYSDATDNDYNSVVVTKSARLYGLNSTLDQLELWINVDLDNVATRVNGTPDKVVDETTAPRLSKATPVVNTDAPDALEVIPRGSLADGGILATATIASNSDLLYVGTDQGLTEIHLANYTNATTFSGWSKFYTTSRQTSLMPGTIRRMHTMDDASGNVTNAAQSSIMTAKGTPTYNIDGVRNRAMTFNGTTQYLCSDANSDATCDNDTTDNINTGGFTVTAWFKHSTTAAGVDTLFARCYNTTPAAATGCFAAAMNASGQMVVTVDDDALWTIGAGTNNDVTYTSTNSYADNQWHFFVLAKYTGATAPVAMIDGQVISYATSLTHATLDNAQILGIGSDCSTGAACATGGNFWDGAIDDFTYSACGSAACTTDGLATTSANAAAVGRILYNDARPLVNKKVYDGAADSVSYSTTVITDSSSPAWIPNEFAGGIVRITSGSGSGQTRRIVSNTASAITVAPALSTTPASNDDFKVDPESLIGSSNNVLAVAVTKDVPIGESRMMCAGTNNTTDGGAVTCYNHQAGPNVIADTYHGDSEYFDDSGAEWTGTDYDDIRSMDLTNRTMVIGSMAHLWLETQDIRLGNALDYFQGKLTDIRSQLLVMGSTTLAGQLGLGVGLVGGADLAEYYYSTEELKPGDVVVIDSSGNGDDVIRSRRRYSGALLGVVSTEPGLILGQYADDGYPIALTGRIPVKFSMENGPVKSGDYLTSASIPGYAMRATGAGPTIGKALTDSQSIETMSDCPGVDLDLASQPTKCGYVMIFVEHGNFSGLPIEQLMQEMQVTVTTEGVLVEGSNEGLVESDINLDVLSETGLESAGVTDLVSTDEKILVFLKHIKQTKLDSGQGISAELFTDRVSAAFEVISPQVTTSGLKVEAIGKLGGSIDILSDTVFFGRPYLNNDTAGFALIKAGQTSVSVEFEKEYIEQPVVFASITGELDASVVKSGDIEKIRILQNQQDELAQELFNQGIQVLVIKKTVTGFTILINKSVSKDIPFSWVALAVKNPKLFDGSKVVGTPSQATEPQPTVAGDSTQQSSSSGSSQSNNEQPSSENIEEEQPQQQEQASEPAQEVIAPAQEEAVPEASVEPQAPVEQPVSSSE